MEIISVICNIVMGVCFIIHISRYNNAMKENKELKRQNELLISENTRLNNQVNADAE